MKFAIGFEKEDAKKIHEYQAIFLKLLDSI